MKKFQKKTFGSKSKEKEPEGLKTASPMPRVFAERYIEELEPSKKEAFVTYRQETHIWDGQRWVVVGVKFGDVASRSVTRDIRKIVEENKPLKKVIHKKDD